MLTQRASVLHFACPIALHWQSQCPCKAAVLHTYLGGSSRNHLDVYKRQILRNATYMGYICYNKSKVNNYLEKKRINNLDETSFVYVKGNFDPIVSEALWHECERIRKMCIRDSPSTGMPRGSPMCASR